MAMSLVYPPNLVVERDADNVNEPKEGNTYDDKYDRKNDSKGVLFLNAAKKTINYPYDIKKRNSENYLQELGKTVKRVDKAFHFYISFQKNIVPYHFSIIDNICQC